MIHPSLILAMMGSNNANNPPPDAREMEDAVANMEKVVARAAIVSLDQEVHPEGGREEGQHVAEAQENEESKSLSSISGPQWAWIVFQLLYSMYMIFNGLFYDCDGVDTLRVWSVVWGLVIFIANVVAPLRGWHEHNSSTAGSHLFLCFIMLYIWGGSAVFPNGTPDEDQCDPNLYEPAFWSVTCGIGFTLTFLLAGILAIKCGKGNHLANKKCPFAPSSSSSPSC